MERKIRESLKYIASVGALLTIIAYISLVVVLIVGFEKKFQFESTLLFSTINAIFGLIVMLLLREQGITFAKSNENNKKIMEDYHEAINKKKKQKKLRTIKSYRLIKALIDLITKSITVLIMSFFVVYIIIEGQNDWSLMLLAVVNILMFVSFGLLSLEKAYNFYNEEHIAAIKELTQRANKNKEADAHDKTRGQGIPQPSRTGSEEQGTN